MKRFLFACIALVYSVCGLAQPTGTTLTFKTLADMQAHVLTASQTNINALVSDTNRGGLFVLIPGTLAPDGDNVLTNTGTGRIWVRQFDSLSVSNLVLSGSGLLVAPSVATVSELQAYVGPANHIFLTDTNRGGCFSYTTSPLTHDGGVIFTASGKGSGFWKRNYTGPVNLLWWGALPNDSTQDLQYLKLAVDAGYTNVYVPPGEYRLPSSGIYYPTLISTSLTISGAGPSTLWAGDPTAVAQSASEQLVQIHTNATSTVGVKISDMNFRNAYAIVTWPEVTGCMQTNDIGHFRFERLNLFETRGLIRHTQNTTNWIESLTVRDCTFDGHKNSSRIRSGSKGIWEVLGGRIKQIEVENVHCKTVSHGFVGPLVRNNQINYGKPTLTQNSVFRNMLFEEMFQDGILSDCFAIKVDGDNMMFENSSFVNCTNTYAPGGGAMLYIHGSEVRLKGLTVINSDQPLLAAKDAGAINMDSRNNILIENCKIDTSTHGITALNYSGVRMVDCLFTNVISCVQIGIDTNYSSMEFHRNRFIGCGQLADGSTRRPAITVAIGNTNVESGTFVFKDNNIQYPLSTNFVAVSITSQWRDVFLTDNVLRGEEDNNKTLWLWLNGTNHFNKFIVTGNNMYRAKLTTFGGGVGFGADYALIANNIFDSSTGTPGVANSISLYFQGLYGGGLDAGSTAWWKRMDIRDNVFINNARFASTYANTGFPTNTFYWNNKTAVFNRDGVDLAMSGASLLSGVYTPEGVVNGMPGTLWMRTALLTNDSPVELWLKQTNVMSTGWMPLLAADYNTKTLTITNLVTIGDVQVGDDINFGGTSSSYPSLMRSSQTIESKLADDSNWADFKAKSIVLDEASATSGNARGVGAVDLQSGRNNSAKVASGVASAILAGTNNTAAGMYSISGQNGNTASAIGSIAFGSGSSVATGSDYAVSQGSNCSVTGTSGDYSLVSGLQATTDLFGALSRASGRFEVNGDSQSSIVTVRRSIQTIGIPAGVGAGVTNSWNPLFLDGDNATAMLTLPYTAVTQTNAVWTFSALVTAHAVTNATSTINYSGSYKIEGCIRQMVVGGTRTTTILGVPVVTAFYEDDAGWDVRASASDTYDALQLEFYPNDACPKISATVILNQVTVGP